MPASFDTIYGKIYGDSGRSGKPEHPVIKLSIAGIPMNGPRFNTPERFASYLKNSKTQKKPDNLQMPGKQYLSQLFYRVDLRNWDISNAHLPEAHISDMLLDGADMTGWDLTDAQISSCLIRKARLTCSTLTKTFFDGCDFIDSDFSNSTLSATIFSDCALQKTSFKGAYLEGIDLSGMDLRDADFSGATLRNVKLIHADLRGVKFDNADLAGTNLSGARISVSQLRNTKSPPAIGPGGPLGACRLRRLHPKKLGL